MQWAHSCHNSIVYAMCTRKTRFGDLQKNESIFQVLLAHNSTASLCEVVISSCRPLMWWLSHIIKLSEVFHVPPHRRFAFARARHSRERFIVLFHDGKTFRSLSSSIITISRNDLNFKKSNEVKTMVDFYLKIEFPLFITIDLLLQVDAHFVIT